MCRGLLLASLPLMHQDISTLCNMKRGVLRFLRPDCWLGPNRRATGATVMLQDTPETCTVDFSTSELSDPGHSTVCRRFLLETLTCHALVARKWVELA